MDFFEVIEKRHSYRGEFKDQPIPKEDLVKIIEAAIKAPSGLNQQTCGFVVVIDPDLRAKLSEIFPHRGIASAPAIIVALSSYKEAYKGKAFEIHDYAAAVENLLLAVTALGYASVWTDGETADGGRQARIAKLLDVPDDQTVRALLPVGVPLEAGRPKEKKPLSERVRFI